ncbi:hypothetical protein TWF106_011677 [Orbilia oligospora]|uniref:Annexin n=1 Tax=Orbilia oligospora TaxID=2813651 RepID=A0A7C8UMZ4_ORBOL|nr:hypothetical protein TWF788_002014 [Orbilia oligospora]KAF3207659.1 hypothetical protein TWF106_011677 [Orbilia oligospora]KAF3213940.1 hypothetical protein TWF191_009938 [Orbilia oligospora]
MADNQGVPPPTGDQQQQQQQWGQPQQQWGQQQQWGPPQGYPQQQQQWGQPQDQQRGYPPPQQQQGQWGQQPQQQWGQPQPQQQQQWGAPPPGPPPQGYPQQQWGGYPPPQQQQQWGPPPPQQQWGQQPPPQGYPPQQQQQQWGAPPPPQSGYQAAAPPPVAGPSQTYTGPAAAPSLGFIPNQTSPNYNPTNDVEVIRKACKGFNTDEKALITTIVKLDPLQIESINQKYTADTKKQLCSLIEDKTRGSLEDGLCALVRGPLNFYVWLVDRATKGMGTKETFLDLALLGRSNADINAIKKAFQAKYSRKLESVVSDDLSGAEQRMFEMVISATRTEEAAGVNPTTVTAEVKALHAATEARMGTNETEVSRIFIKSNDATILAIATEYERTYHQPVESLIKSEFSGHQKEALLYILRGVQDKAKRDAELIEGTMKGLGTRNEELAFRLIAAHWIPGAIPAVKVAYNRLYGKDLVARVRDETSGDFERLLVAILNK